MIAISSRQCGLSLTEVLIALALTLLATCVVLPAAASALERVRVARVQGELAEAFLLSARHAVAAGAPAVLCPSAASGNGCADANDWSAGWLAFADLDGDRRYSAGDTLLRRSPALAGGLRLLASSRRTRIVFQPHGGSAGSNASFAVCAGSQKRLGTLVLSNAGQFRWQGRASRGPEPCEI
ncbi:hypothetical protein A7A76_00690 [Lysobacter enzymogenes]|uniref:GspH/FimT family protein n=1 Tax=Lysobacter enzymogenes TaxID=69 RepID=UPI0019D0F232|nr:GspH/FimT family pseudopilin [Lysobacter enzymogenes]MBN7138473.1 hypothetical protein [Lysobacter enzymogenes]